jgi:ABC-type iron transport system FetAB ATPase subunit
VSDLRLEARDLSIAFGDRVVLDRVTFGVRPGEIAVLEGPSGAGKSTLLRALATLEPASAGEVFVDGIASSTLAPTAFRRRVAYVPQLPVMFPGTVADNVAAGPRLIGERPSASWITERLARAALPASMAERRAADLSGGEKQRVAIARALALDPEAVLFDEPTSALDPETRDAILELVRSCARDGRAVVVVTHSAQDATALAGTRWLCDHRRVERSAS